MEKRDETVSGQQKYDFTFVYYTVTGKSAVDKLKEKLKSYKNNEFPVTESEATDENVKQAVIETAILVVILSKDVLKKRAVIQSLELASLCPTVQVALVHDPDTCFFPGPAEQPETIRHHFNEKAITYLSDYAETAAEQLVKKLQEHKSETQNKSKQNVQQTEDIHTRLFLSHRRLTAQGIAGRLYEGLKGDYRVFLDSEAQFKIHNLEQLVEKTDVFVCILSVGYLDSQWCVVELKKAILSKRKIIVIRDYQYHLPAELPKELEDVKSVLLSAPTFSWMAEYNNQCVAKIKDVVGVPDAFLEKMKKWMTENPSEAIKIQHKDSYSLNLSKLGELNVTTFLTGLKINMEFPIEQVKVLNLQKTTFSDADVPALTYLQLVHLILAGTKVTSNGLKQIIDQCKDLQYLDISECDVGDEIFLYLGKALKDIQQLNITYCFKITDDAINQFTKQWSHVKLRF